VWVCECVCVCVCVRACVHVCACARTHIMMDFGLHTVVILNNTLHRDATLCSSESIWCTGGIQFAGQVRSPPASCSLLILLILQLWRWKWYVQEGRDMFKAEGVCSRWTWYVEDGRGMFLRRTGLSLNYTVLQPRRPYFRHIFVERVLSFNHISCVSEFQRACMKGETYVLKHHTVRG
jgi:hypothetical protein